MSNFLLLYLTHAVAAALGFVLCAVISVDRD